MLNPGQEAGLWGKLRAGRRKSACPELPLIALCWAAHRAFRDLEENVMEVRRVILDCTSMSAYFHQSSARTARLIDIAKKANLSVIQLLKHFELRFTQFTCNLLESIPRSSRALFQYMQNALTRKSQFAGFLKILMGYYKLMAMAFLNDSLDQYSNYQKGLQSNASTLQFLRCFKRSSARYRRIS